MEGRGTLSAMQRAPSWSNHPVRAVGIASTPAKLLGREDERKRNVPTAQTELVERA